MKVIFVVLVAFLSLKVFVWLMLHSLKAIREWMIATGRHQQMNTNVLNNEEWNPTFHLEHNGITLFHLPFEPDKGEVFYLENEYDEEANRFIVENKELIIRRFAVKGFNFVYLPDQEFSREELLRYILYRDPSLTTEDVEERISSIPRLENSSMLLDYMVFPIRRKNIKSCFVWFNYSHTTFQDSHRIRKYIFDFISFDGREAIDAPDEVLNEICQELGKGKRWLGGLARTQKRDFEQEDADERFDYDIRQLLDEVREKVNMLRIRGVSDAVISRYVREQNTPSRLLITEDMRIFLPDYHDMEVKLEPLNKAVFLLFLRHEDGFRFKELSDHVRELSAIYQSIKQKRNEIDTLMNSNIPIPKNIAEVANPLSNSINEKCTRIKEAFLLLMHEDLACHYYINGQRSEKKRIKLSRQLVEWKGGER